MGRRRSFTQAAAGVGLAVAMAPAWAQSVWYRCPSDTGGTTLSDRPCSAQGRTSIISYGPIQEPARATPPGAPLKRAPDHLQYLSAHCAQLNDALRTAPGRGLRGQPLQDLQDTHRRDCAEEEQAAQQQLYRSRQEMKEAARARQSADRAERDQQQVQREQCNEMQRILHTRRQRLETLDDGQKADLRRFQDSYMQRCRAG